MSKVKMTEAEKKVWLEKTDGNGVFAKVGINDTGNAIVVQDAGGNTVGHTRYGTIRVIEMTAGEFLPSVKSRHVVASKVIATYGLDLTKEGLAEQHKLQEKGVQFAQSVLRGEKKLSRSREI